MFKTKQIAQRCFAVEQLITLYFHMQNAQYFKLDMATGG